MIRKMLLIFVLIAITGSDLLFAFNNGYNNKYRDINPSSYILDSRGKRKRIRMKENYMHVRQKSSSPIVLQFIDNISVFFNFNSDYEINIVDEYGLIIYNTFVSVNNSPEIIIDIDNYPEGLYYIKIILSENNFYIGSFIIE